MFGDGRHGKLALSEKNFANQFLPTPVTRFRGFFVQQVSCFTSSYSHQFFNFSLQPVI